MTASLLHHACSGADQILTTFPAVRYGRVVAAHVHDSEAERVLRYSEGDIALELLKKRASAFGNVTRSAITKTGKNLGLRIEFPANRPPLQRATRAPGLGFAFEFSEICFRIAGALIVARISVTLCVLENIFRTKDREEHTKWQTHSKLWARFILAEHPKSKNPGRHALNLDDDVLKEFDERCAVLSETILDAITPHYERVVSDATGSDIFVVPTGSFAVVALGTREADFMDLLDAAQAGEPLSELIGQNACATRLASLATAILRPSLLLQVTTPTEAIRNLDARFIVFDGPMAQRGLFLATFGDGRVKFVGLTQVPEPFEPKSVSDGPPANLNKYAANAVSAGLIAEYASYF